jgi:uncharacterized protein YdeI (YjbR/CyaY-like superfamily)
MSPLFFNDQSALRTWYEQHHLHETELLVGYYKVKTNKATITWSQSVDEAVCFGWIDGIRRSIDQETYCIRFTPRRPGSNWSKVNIAKAEKLIREGQMFPAGMEAFSRRNAGDSNGYSYEANQSFSLDETFLRQFRKNIPAWTYYQSETPSYRKITTRWVMTAKQEITRNSRLKELIGCCEAGERISAMRSRKKQYP